MRPPPDARRSRSHRASCRSSRRGRLRRPRCRMGMASASLKFRDGCGCRATSAFGRTSSRFHRAMRSRCCFPRSARDTGTTAAEPRRRRLARRAVPARVRGLRPRGRSALPRLQPGARRCSRVSDRGRTGFRAGLVRGRTAPSRPRAQGRKTRRRHGIGPVTRRTLGHSLAMRRRARRRADDPPPAAHAGL